jgi:hypothetical protein
MMEHDAPETGRGAGPAQDDRGGTLSDFNGANRPDDDTASSVKQTAQDKAVEGVGLVSEKATDTVGTVKERAGDVAGEASAQARDVVGELRDQLQDQARTQTQRLAHTVRQLAEDLGDMGKSGAEDSPTANAVRQVAGRGHDLAARLEERGPQGLVSDLQDFARRRPGVFLAGAALAGFATARLGKGAKSASTDAFTHPDGDRSGRSVPGAGGVDRPGAITEAQLHATTGPSDTYGQPQPTPSYGGPVTPSGPLPVTDPYPTPDPQQP